MNSGKLRNHWSMNWAQFKDLHCYLCLHGALLAWWFITQEVGGSNTPLCKNNFYRFCRFFRINLGKTRIIHTSTDRQLPLKDFNTTLKEKEGDCESQLKDLWRRLGKAGVQAYVIKYSTAVVDPGFPRGGVWTFRGRVQAQHTILHSRKLIIPVFKTKM